MESKTRTLAIHPFLGLCTVLVSSLSITWSKKKDFPTLQSGYFMGTWNIFRGTCTPLGRPHWLWTSWISRENRPHNPEAQSQGQLWTWCVFTIFQKLPHISHWFPFSTIGIGKLKDQSSFQGLSYWCIYTEIISRSATVTSVCGSGPQSSPTLEHRATHVCMHTQPVGLGFPPAYLMRYKFAFNGACLHPNRNIPGALWLPQALAGCTFNMF